MSRDRWVGSLQCTTPSLALRSRSFLYGAPCSIARAQGLAPDPPANGQGLGLDFQESPARHLSGTSADSYDSNPHPHHPPSPHNENNNYSNEGTSSSSNGGVGVEVGVEVTSVYASPERRTRRISLSKTPLSDMLHSVASAVSHAMHTQVCCLSTHPCTIYQHPCTYPINTLVTPINTLLHTLSTLFPTPVIHSATQCAYLILTLPLSLTLTTLSQPYPSPHP